MGAVTYPKLSTVKPLLCKLLTKTLKITQGDTGNKAEGYKKDVVRQTRCEENIINMATFLELRYKELQFLDSYSKRGTKEEIAVDNVTREPEKEGNFF